MFASAIGPRIPLSPPDAAGSAGGEGAAAGGADAGGDAAADAAAAAAGADKGGAGGEAAADAKPARPDFIPEDWWDADKGFKADDLNALKAFKAEHDSNLAQVPEKPDGYKAALPKDFKVPDGFELAEGESLIDENDPRILAAREFAHGKKMSQTDFEELIAFGVQMDITEQQTLKDAVVKQKELLGTKAVERISSVKNWVAAKLGGEHAEALTAMMYTAKQIEAFEALMRLNRGAVPGGPGAGRDSGKIEMSDAEYDKMSPAERINYARQHSKR